MEKFEKIALFIRTLYKQPHEFIPLHAPIFMGNEKKYLEQCIDSTYVSSVGKFVDDFEEKIAEYTGAQTAVVCVNGTNALHLALVLAGVRRNNEVITQPLTFIATANSIKYCGAHPVFLDIDQDTLGLSPKALLTFLRNKTITNSHGCYNINTKRKISACVPMHTFGNPCRIDEIVSICKDFKIEVVEDAAESVGSFYKKQHTGTFGKIGVLSFNGNKIITTGGGGMLLFKDERLAKQAKHLTTQARVPHQWEFIHDAIGYNYRMPNLNAALGLAQLEQIEKFLKSKRKVASAYQEFFSANDTKFVKESPEAKSNYWLNSILLNNKEERDAFLKYTNSVGIMTRPPWRLMNELPMFKNSICDDLTNAKMISSVLVNLPSSVIHEK